MLDAGGDVLGLFSSQKFLVAVIPGGLVGFALTTGFSRAFTLPFMGGYVRRNPQFRVGCPPILSIGRSWLAAVSRFPVSPTAAMSSAGSTGTMADVSRAVVSTMYRVSDWGAKAVASMLDRSANNNAFQGTDPDSYGSFVAVHDCTTSAVVCELCPFGDAGSTLPWHHAPLCHCFRRVSCVHSVAASHAQSSQHWPSRRAVTLWLQPPQTARPTCFGFLSLLWRLCLGSAMPAHGALS